MTYLRHKAFLLQALYNSAKEDVRETLPSRCIGQAEPGEVVRKSFYTLFMRGVQ